MIDSAITFRLPSLALLQPSPTSLPDIRSVSAAQDQQKVHIRSCRVQDPPLPMICKLATTWIEEQDYLSSPGSVPSYDLLCKKLSFEEIQLGT
jgi:hypothetical protein